MDHFNEMMISSGDSPPSPPIVDVEHKDLLQHYLELFGFKVNWFESNIVQDDRKGHCIMLHDWLKEDDSDGELSLLYRASRDGLSSQAFHSNCDGKGCTITIIKTTNGIIMGGYSNTSWERERRYAEANKAFLFVLSGNGISSPCKMKLKKPNGEAILNSEYGPAFGDGDMRVTDSIVRLYPGGGYDAGPFKIGAKYTIREMEVFQVTRSSSLASITASTKTAAHDKPMNYKPVKMFSAKTNEAINAKHLCLH